MSRKEILSTLAAHEGELRALGARRIGLFGSAARDEARPASDLDFVVDLSPKTFDAYMDVKALLERLFNRRVDLVLVDGIKPRLRDRILAETVYAP